MGERDGGETGATPIRFCRSCGTRLSEPIGRFCQSCGDEVGAGAGDSSSSTAEPTSSPRPRARRSSLLWAVVVIALVAVVAVGAILLAGGSGSSKKSNAESAITTLPSPNEMPPQTVALVIHVPSELGTITRGDLDRAIAHSLALSDDDPPPAPGSSKYNETAESALRELLDGVWLQGEAAELDLEVMPSEIAEERAKLKRESFKSEAQYRKFLAESHYTEEDVRERVKEQILSAKIRGKIEGDAKSPKSDEVLADFIARYDKRWRSRTVCLPKYAIEECSNGPAPAQASQSGNGETAIPTNP